MKIKRSDGSARFFIPPQEWVHRIDYDCNGRKLSGCDVCWTCEWFDVFSSVCNNMSTTKLEYDKFVIKNPEWYRCAFYNE